MRVRYLMVGVEAVNEVWDDYLNFHQLPCESPPIPIAHASPAICKKTAIELVALVLSPSVCKEASTEPRQLLQQCWARIHLQATINRRLRIGRDGHLDQSESYDIS